MLEITLLQPLPILCNDVFHSIPPGLCQPVVLITNMCVIGISRRLGRLKVRTLLRQAELVLPWDLFPRLQCVNYSCDPPAYIFVISLAINIFLLLYHTQTSDNSFNNSIIGFVETTQREFTNSYAFYLIH